MHISHSAKAILPAIGIHADDSGLAWPSIKWIIKLSGVKSNKTVIEGIRSLIELDLIQKEKKDRHNVYILKPPAIWTGGSYYPMSELFIKYTWQSMTYIEKAAFAVLAVKATINRPELISVGDPDIFGAGYIQKKQFIRLAGIARSKWDTAIDGLVAKEIITLDDENDYTVYK